MDPLDLTQSFVERCERSASPQELTATFQTILEQMGFRYFACCSHVNPLRPPQSAVILHNYPSEWVGSYAARDLQNSDPVFRRAEREILPFRWSAPEFRVGLTPAQKRIMEEAARAGIANGYTVPIHLPWADGPLRASCSVIPESSSIEDRAYRAVQIMAPYLYASVSDRRNRRVSRAEAPDVNPVLTMRERQCLELAAEGKSDWDISRLLGISDHTVHKHVEAAKRRLGVSTRIQAIVWAVQHGEICFGDVVTSIERDRCSISPRRRARQTLPIRRPPTC